MPTHVVPTFGGGINVSANPVHIADDEWSWCDGWWPNRGTAEMMRGYTKVTDTWLGANYDAVGLVADTFTWNRLLLVSVAGADPTDVVVKYAALMGGGVATVTLSGTSAHCTSSDGVSGMGVVNGLGYIALGRTASGGYGVLQFNNASTQWSRVDDSGLSGRYLTTAAGHVLLAYTASTEAGKRTVRVSAVNDGTDWTATVANDADSISLDSPSILTGIAPIQAGAVVSSIDDLFLLRSTGSIPPFIVERVQGRGSLTAPVTTPVGTFVNSHDGVYAVGGARVSDRLGTLIRHGYEMAWHPEYSAIVFAAATSATTEEVLYLDPATGRAWRIVLPTGVQYLNRQTGVHCVARHLLDSAAGSEQGIYLHALLDGQSGVVGDDIYAESATLTAAKSGATVDTKDFAFGSPPQLVRHDRIKVDWECLANATTDAIKVYAAARDHLAQSLLGSNAMEMNNLTWTLLGTLTGGTSEMHIDVMGKYVRYRFEQSSGKARIRGFSIRWAPAGERQIN